MMTAAPRLLLALLVAVSANGIGCKKAKLARKAVETDDPVMPTAASDEVARDLKQLARAYYDFQDAHRRPPRSFEELNSQFPVPPRCAQATVVWGAGVGLLCGPDGCSNLVLGYLPNPNGRGKVVVFCDGGPRLMTDEEFRAAKMATPLAK
jgi:hypothetical protein